MKKFIILFWILAFSSIAAGADYQVTDLTGFGFEQALKINDSGTMVGHIFQGVEFTSYSFSLAKGLTIIQSQNWGANMARGINNNGQVVGQSVTTDDPWLHGYIYDKGATVVLPSESYLLDINDLGTSVGCYASRACIYTHQGGLVDIGTLGGVHSDAVAINNAGWVVGQSEFSTESDLIEHLQRAFLYDSNASTLIDIGTLGGYESVAGDINNNGIVVGASNVYTDVQDLSEYPGVPKHPFIYDTTNGMRELPGLMQLSDVGGAGAINDRGQIVGISGSNMVLWQDNTIIDLNQYFPAGWSNMAATDINNLGQIVGMGYYNGQQRAFLLTPIPEPATMAMFLLGGLAIARRRKH